MENLPPKKTPEELLDKMRDKNIRFDLKTEDEIIEYLRKHNNYFRTASYRKNYEKYPAGKNKGKYIDLDFGYLSELATIDMHLRFQVLKMCLDVEHSLKVSMLADITANSQEDGYSIVKGFLLRNKYLINDIYYKSKSTYVGDLIDKYFIFCVSDKENDKIDVDKTVIKCPVWAFMEIVTFGDFTKFYSMYYEIYPNKENYTGILHSVKSLRNACAHNNYLIHDLSKGTSKPTAKISQFVASIPTISTSQRKSCLSVRVVYELTALVYLYSKTTFEPVKKYRLFELNDLVNKRMVEHKEYFRNQDIIKSSYTFFKKVVDFLIETTYNNNDNKKL